MENQIYKEYQENKIIIKNRLEDFKNLKEKEYLYELLFCILTPQSNAKKCWTAVEEIKKLEKPNEKNIADILRTRTRFHNNKSRYIISALSKWDEIKTNLSKENKKELRNWLSEEIKGYGLKEASHFLRNIGKSNNEIAILDRHILRNLKKLNIISEEKIKNNKHYLEIEDKFIKFSQKTGIPIDELDLLFWSRENGDIFK